MYLIRIYRLQTIDQLQTMSTHEATAMINHLPPEFCFPAIFEI